jgi:hypothetical protein
MERLAYTRLLIATGLCALAITSAILIMVNSQSIQKVAKQVRDSASSALDDTLEKMSKGELTFENA